MGLLLDTSILIAGERHRLTVKDLLADLQKTHGETEMAISAISVVELTHGIYRARNEADRERRRLFADEIFRDLFVHPVSTEIARLAGQIEGEQASLGNIIAFEDLVIGATALHLDFAILTLNVRHFSRIPELQIWKP